MYSQFMMHGQKNIKSSVIRSVCEICGKYGKAGQDTDDNVIRRTSIACWITRVTVTHSEYVTLTAFPQQRWLHERASIVRYTYSALLARVNVAISRTKVTTVPVVPMVTKCTKVFPNADTF